MKNQYEAPILANTSSGANAYDEARKEEEHESNRHRAPGGGMCYNRTKVEKPHKH